MPALYRLWGYKRRTAPTEMSARPRRRSSVGGHLAALAGAKRGADDGPIGDDVEGSAGAALDPEPREHASRMPTVTVVAPERDAELRHVLQKPSNDRTYDDILPVKNWLRATPWGKAMLESVMGLETFRIDEASSPLPRARHARRGA